MPSQLIELAKIEIDLNTEIAFNHLELQDSPLYAPDVYLSAGYQLGMLQQSESLPSMLRNDIKALALKGEHTSFFKSGYHGAFYNTDVN